MEKRDYLKQMLIYFIDPSMSFLEKHGSCQMEVPELSLIASLLKILNIYLGKYKGVKKLPKKIESFINQNILYSLIWSIGAIQDENSRKKFSEFIKEIIGGKDAVKNF
jgi:hypothetical protein